MSCHRLAKWDPLGDTKRFLTADTKAVASTYLYHVYHFYINAGSKFLP